MTTAVDQLIAQLQQNRTADLPQPVVVDVDLLILALQQLQSGGGAVGANPTATASDVAVNGVATTFLRSDGAPAVQKATAAQFGIVQPDNVTISISGGGLLQAAPGSFAMPVTFTGATGNFTFNDAPTFSTGELLIQNNQVNCNVITLQNLNNGSAFSAMAFRGADNAEHGAIGFGNAGAPAIYAGATYFESSNFAGGTGWELLVPPDMVFTQSGALNGHSPGTFNARQRMYGATGEISWFNSDGVTKEFTLTDTLATLSISSHTGSSNALAIQNRDNAGFSTIEIDDLNGVSKAFFGYGNPGTPLQASTAYLMTNAVKLSIAVFSASVHEIAFLDPTNFHFALTPSTPASSAAAGVAGSIQVDANFIYVCTAANTWKRAALTAF